MTGPNAARCPKAGSPSDSPCPGDLQAYSLGRLNHGGGWVLTTDEHQYWEGLAVASSGLVLAFSLLQSLYEVLQIHAQGIKLYLG